MKQVTKKILCALLAGAMAASVAACSSPASSGGGDAASTGGSDAASTADDGGEAASDEPIELTFWHIWPDDQMADIVDSYLAQYKEEHPNITIESVATQEVEYQNNKLKIAAATGSQGDVFMCWGGGYAQSYVEAGVVLPLDEYFESSGALDDMLDGALTYCTYDGQAYGLPLKQWAGTLFCNQDLFDQYNVEIPKTWDQLMTAVETFRANGVTPMVLGAKDAWHIGMIQNALAVCPPGPDYMNQALMGEATFDTPEIVQSAQLTVDLMNAGAFVDGTLGIGSEEAQEEFYMGMVPMYYGGSWCAAGCDNPDNAISQCEVTVTQMPTVEGGKGDENTYSGGVIDFFMINANTEHPDEAFDFALGMTKYMSEECYKIGDSLPAWDLDIDESEVSPTLIKIREMIQPATGYVLAWDTFLTGAAIDAHYQLLQGLIAGTTTPEEFASGMQEAMEAELADSAAAE